MVCKVPISVDGEDNPDAGAEAIMDDIRETRMERGINRFCWQEQDRAVGGVPRNNEAF